jgi:hypothetical protein
MRQNRRESDLVAVQQRLAARAKRTAQNDDRIRRRLYPGEGDAEREHDEEREYQEEHLRQVSAQKQQEAASERIWSQGSNAVSTMEHPWAMGGQDVSGTALVRTA